jgi:hypothetical protein
METGNRTKVRLGTTTFPPVYPPSVCTVFRQQQPLLSRPAILASHHERPGSERGTNFTDFGVHGALRPLSYRSTLSSTQIPPDTFDIVSSNRFFVIDNATGDIISGTINLGRSKAETRNGSPAGLPFSGSK